MDVMLPDGDGRDLARRIRLDSDLLIIMLTARGEELDRVVGLEIGADDYVVKRFFGAQPDGPASERSCGELPPTSEGARYPSARSRLIQRLARARKMVYPLSSPRGNSLMSNAGEVVRREQIMDEVWDPHWFGPTKTLDVHIIVAPQEVGG
jgi:two-component system, OmpR family, response regulator RegX3